MKNINESTKSNLTPEQRERILVLALEIITLMNKGEAAGNLNDLELVASLIPEIVSASERFTSYVENV